MFALASLFWLLPGINAAAEVGVLKPQDSPVIQPEVRRSEFSEARIDTEDFELGFYFGFMSVEDFGTNPVYGLRLAYHVTEDIFIEAAYGTTDTDKTSFERLNNVNLMTDAQRQLTYYNVSFGYNLFMGEVFFGRSRAFNTALYIIAGGGSTEFAGDARFTMNYGMGYRFLAADWLAMHLDVRDHIFDIDLLGQAKTTHNIELHIGATLFF
ncbi:MAG: outer membrane beta-barrel domain-containing protein [Gammaproteobacteria bacterium]